ncbi:MAG: AraC family transcriptional regulator ligand-binding domain-containing protein [Rouxiella aceris]|uniref:AraC family transcriptional regulator ligand-binding domain-containing protein n=1 Tax=Rouxiella aceris TaxID=2703884 RepID=UPI00284A4DCE|nr:AraC family transcriptional regulator ligand-binding domain-containing protein [Rouxiella aceris]MDR3434196.1 AraC family transcriptional regulator ligand-binding domain-containing protein [Rouxiella aceris]
MTESFADRIKVPAVLWLGLENVGISVSALLRQAQLPLGIFTNPGAITTCQYFAIWQGIFDITGDATIGLKLIAALPTGKLPPSLLAAYHARDFRDALLRIARYKRLCIPEQLHFEEEDNQCFIELSWLYAEQAEPAPLVDASLATLMEIVRRGTGVALNASLVELRHTAMDVSLHEAWFGCRVRVGAQHNRLHLHRSDLDRPFVSYNAELLAMLAPALDQQLVEYQHQHSFSDTVCWLLGRQLSAGRPDIPAVSREMGVSERTLQRRLSEEGTSFNSLLSTVRRTRAHKLLADPELDLTEVALLLGYEDQSSFFRAFRLWENQTPSAWRRLRLNNA